VYANNHSRKLPCISSSAFESSSDLFVHVLSEFPTASFLDPALSPCQQSQFLSISFPRNSPPGNTFPPLKTEIFVALKMLQENEDDFTASAVISLPISDHLMLNFPWQHDFPRDALTSKINACGQIKHMRDPTHLHILAVLPFGK
jgi:hypothetical protein